eukprot:6189304-Pleurochrysis_carterae.AAC.1
MFARVLDRKRGESEASGLGNGTQLAKKAVVFLRKSRATSPGDRGAIEGEDVWKSKQIASIQSPVASKRQR